MWEPLEAGDTIAVVSTGYALNKQNFDGIVSGLRKAMPMFNFLVPADLLSKECQENTSRKTMPSNTPRMCALHVINALENPKVKAIWCATGSEGSSAVISVLEEYQKDHQLAKGKKPIIGMSDTTSLQTYLSKNQLASYIHFDLLTTLFVPALKPKIPGLVARELDAITHLLMGGKNLKKFELNDSLIPLNDAAKKTENIKGEVTGGCKEVIDDGFGTSWQVDMKDKILIIEGMDQPWTSFGGIFTIKKIREYWEIHGKPKALVIGQIVSFKVDGESKKSFFNSYWQDVIKLAKHLDIPVFKWDNFGHDVDKFNHPTPMLSYGSITKQESGKFKFSTDLTVSPKIMNNPKEEKRKVFSDFQYITLMDMAAMQLMPIANTEKSDRVISGEMVGGDLSEVTNTLHKEIIDTRDAIIFLHYSASLDKNMDLSLKVPMYTHAILLQLNQAGFFKPAKAIILGQAPRILGLSSEKYQQFEIAILEKLKYFAVHYNVKIPIYYAQHHQPFPERFFVEKAVIYNGKNPILTPQPGKKQEIDRRVAKHYSQNKFQATVAKEIVFKGCGFHSGEPVTITICPAAENTGIVFKRVDKEDDKGTDTTVIPFAPYVTEVKLKTMISNIDDVSVSTLEHLMASFYMAGITNAVIYINGPEVPIMDGSALPFYEMLRYSTSLQAAEKYVTVVKKPVQIFDEARNSIATLIPYNGFTVNYKIQFKNHYAIGEQTASFDVSQSDENAAKIINSRTFTFHEELEKEEKKGIRTFAKTVSVDGGDSSAVVFNEYGITTRGDLRYPNEPACHKLLDFLGDAYLHAGFISAQVCILRGGHEVHNKLLLKLLSDGANYEVMKWSEVFSHEKTTEKHKIPLAYLNQQLMFPQSKSCAPRNSLKEVKEDIRKSSSKIRSKL